MPLVVAAGVLIGGCSASHPLQVQIVPPSPSPSAAPSQSPPAELEALWCVVSGGILTVRFINNEPQTVYLYSFDVDIFDSQGDLLGAPQVDASTVSQAIALAIAPTTSGTSPTPPLDLRQHRAR